jgi:HK97 family phage portal protein
MSKSARRHRRSIENPRIPLTGDDESLLLSASGVRVTERKALGYAAVWRAVNLISTDVAKLSLLVNRFDGAAKVADKQHPAYSLLRWKPNEAMTAFSWKQAKMGHVLLKGNAYSYIERSNDGRPLSAYLLNPDKMVPTRVNGRLWYAYETPQVEWRKLPAEDVLHWKGLGYDGLEGYPVLEYVAETVGAAIASRDHSARYFKNGARPGGVLTNVGKVTAEARRNMRESWERLHTGLTNAHKVAILEEGTTYVPIPSDARSAQLLESREFDSREIANIFGVPAHKLGDSSKVAYNSLGEENQSYYDDTLSGWLISTSMECRDKLLTEEEKRNESHEIEYDYKEITRANFDSQISYASTMVSAGDRSQ